MFPVFNLPSRCSNAMEPSSIKSGGPNMKIKQQLPSLIRSNSHQAGVTKAEQEKPLTANHCIDRQASPPTTSRSPAPPLPSIPAHRLTCVLRLVVHWPEALSLYASVWRDVFGGGPLSLAAISISLCRFFCVDCAFFCPFALPRRHQALLCWRSP